MTEAWPDLHSEIHNHRVLLRNLGYQVADKSYAFSGDEVARVEELLGRGNVATSAPKLNRSNATSAGVILAVLGLECRLILMQSCANQDFRLLRRSANTTPLECTNINLLRERQAAAAI